MFSLADANAVLEAATALGFEPPRSDLSSLAGLLRWDQARAAVGYFWEQHPDRLHELIGEAARIALLPDTARITSPGPWCGCHGLIDDCRCTQRDAWP